MAENIVGDISQKFDDSLAGFYESAAMGIANYVLPIAWILLGICLLIWCYLVIEGKVVMPVTDWLLKFLGFMIVFYAMGNGYLSWVARPIFDLPFELTTALSRSPLNAVGLIGQVNEKILDLVSAMFTAGSRLVKEFAFGPAVTLFLMGLLTVAAAYLMLSIALFAIMFSKLGLSMVLAFGPFFFNVSHLAANEKLLLRLAEYCIVFCALPRSQRRVCFHVYWNNQRLCWNAK